MQIIKLTKANQFQVIKQAIQVLKKNGLIIYPTDTCYGAGVDPTSSVGVDKLYVFKGQRRTKPVSIAVADQVMAQKYVNLNQTAKFFYRHFLPGPYTIISRSKMNVDKRLVAADNSLGIRIPKNDFILKLIRAYGKPLTSTSANPSGTKTPYSVSEVVDNLSSKKQKLIDLIIDAGSLNKANKPSTVINSQANLAQVLRGDQWPFKLEMIKNFTSTSAETTIVIGRQILKLIKKDLQNKSIKPTVIFLSGILAAGKTHLAKGIGQQVGVKQIIKSTSFNLFNQYPLNLSNWRLFVHADLWRLNKADEAIKQSLKQYLSNNNLITIEWASIGIKFILDFQNIYLYFIELEHVSPKTRKISLFRIKT